MRRVLMVALVVASAACAARTASMPPVPTTPRYPDFVYPAVADAASMPVLADRVERGWRYLQADDLRGAEREFTAALETGTSAPAETGLAYVDLAREAHDAAIARFDGVLTGGPQYVPALVGRGQALLAAGRDGEALASFETALAIEDVPGLRARVDVLRFRAVQDNLARARTATDAGEWDAARAAYEQAIAASPESAFLYRDLADVERQAGQLPLALSHAQKALSLDAADARSHSVLADILDGQGDAAGALAALERARAIDPDEVSDERLARARDKANTAGLPLEYQAIRERPWVSRGDLAALLGVRLQRALATVRQRQVVITDIRGHWAQSWILAVARAGVMEELPNYTFRPDTRVTRVDMAQVVDRALRVVAARRPDVMTTWQRASAPIPDVPAAHLAFPAVSLAVASGVMRLDSDGLFHLLRPVTGTEAQAIVDRLEALLPS